MENKYLHINFTGSSCTGKTTLFNALRDENTFQEHVFFRSISREMIKEGKHLNEESTCKLQSILFERYKTLLYENYEKKYISERCIIDVCAFTSLLLDYKDPKDEDYNDFATLDFDMRRDLLRCKHQLGLVAYIPIEIDLQYDGERLFDEEKRKVFDLKIQQILSNYSIPHVVIKGIVEERVYLINEVMKKGLSNINKS